MLLIAELYAFDRKSFMLLIARALCFIKGIKLHQHELSADRGSYFMLVKSILQKKKKREKKKEEAGEGREEEKKRRKKGGEVRATRVRACTCVCV